MDKMNLDYWRLQLDEYWLECINKIHKGKNIDEAIDQAYLHLIADETRAQNATLADFKQLVNSWLSNKRFPKKEKTNRVDLTGI